MTSHMPKNRYTKKTNKLVIFSILRHNLSKFVTQTGLDCSKQLETTFNQVGKKSLHIIFKRQLTRPRFLALRLAGVLHGPCCRCCFDVWLKLTVCDAVTCVQFTVK